MYIQFSDFYKILQHFEKPNHPQNTKRAKHSKYGLFDSLFSSYLKNDMIGPTSVSKMINNYRPVKQEIQDFYSMHGTGLLAADIQEHVFPKLTSAHGFAEILYWSIQQDPFLPKLLKHTVAEHYPPEEESALSLYIATVLYAVITRPHYPSKKNMAPVFPQWMAENMDDLLLSRMVPSPSSAFTGRGKELKQLHTLLEKRHNVIVWGIHGIGKSELVYKYCEKYKGDYRKILYVNSSGDLQKDICKLHIVGGITPTGNMFFDVMQCLCHLREDTLLVIDNMNNLEDQKLIWELIQQCGCKLLVTTRCQVPENQRKEHLELNAISSMRSLINLLKKLTEREDLKKSILEKIIIRLHRHTTSIVLLAALLQTDRYTPEEILEKLGPRKLKDFIKDCFYYRNDRTSFYEHLSNLFSLFCFEGQERYALQNMALVPNDGVPLKLFEAWTELTNTDVISTLIDTGLIYGQSYNTAHIHRYMVSLKPILKELACDELVPSIQSCAKLIHNTAKAMDTLEDDQNMQYLIQLSQEVIALAEKDDIPVYIDYLHKSFEVAVRYNQKDEMKTIVQDLENVLTVTPYGTNRDIALTMDYRASVQSDAQNAIAYRKRAIEFLDSGIPEEKKLQAEILDRIAGDYLLLEDWMHAKPYSDASWSLFRELGLLDMPETLPAYCRRGVILCHTGKEDEGLTILKQAENNFINTELQPTQNRVYLQTALREAYEVIGNFNESEKYEKMVKRSLVYLQERMKADI